MKLKSLLENIEFRSKDIELLDEEVHDIKINHKDIENGDIFIALKGVNSNGNDFAVQALEKGALCVITDDVNLDSDRAVYVKNSRSAYALMSKNYFGKACDKLKIVAITGTNGKTTTTHTVAGALNSSGRLTASIGTLGANFKGETIDTGLTTPDPYLLHKLFAKIYEEGGEYVIMEASAHALALNKLDGIKFEVGLLTNITEDHLDFFGNMENYARAKFKLFDKKRCKRGVVCEGKNYVNKLRKLSDIDIISYGFNKNCDFFGEILDKSIHGSHFLCNAGNEKLDIHTPLVGSYNIENALATVAICKLLGLTNNEIEKGLRQSQPVEGRFNIIKAGNVNVIVDFAHTPDGLEKVLTTAREVAKGKLIVIFGCGGNRDRLKRPIMGEIASRLADEVIITSDNPRNEEPLSITKEIEKGTSGNAKIIVNRREAILETLQNCRGGETVIIAGKGAEKYQEINGIKYPFSDYEVIDEFLDNKEKI